MNVIKQIRYYYYREQKGIMEISRMLHISRYKVAFWLGILKRKPKTKRMRDKQGILNYELERFNNAIRLANLYEIEDPKQFAKDLRKKFIKKFGVKPEDVYPQK